MRTPLGGLRRFGRWGMLGTVLLGAGCGEPTETDACNDADCFRVGAAVCDGETLVTFQTLGACVDGACAYDVQSQRTCEFGCANDRCTPDPGCDGACDTPPESRCEGDVIVRSVADTCRAPTCTFETAEEDCAARGLTCAVGRCVPACPGGCGTPPAGTCDGTVAVSYVAPGRCASGSCAYDPQTVDCAESGQRCDGGSCVDTIDCEGVTCDAPPPAACEGDAAVTYGAGTCDDQDGCVYARQREVCSLRPGWTCRDGRCAEQTSCDGVTCQTPPGTCEGDVALRVINARCDSETATCVGDDVREDCGTDGRRCVSGLCVDTCGTACVGQSAFLPFCEAAVAVTPASRACVDGLCVDQERRVDCAATGQTCARGLCVATDPCVGVTCDTVPLPYCDANVAVVPTANTCAAGDCAVTATRTNCSVSGATCAAGTCVVADPCDGVVCVTPPGDVCLDGGRALVYGPTGTCISGACSYAATVAVCAGGSSCAEGVCAGGDACTGVTCASPPPPDCAGNVALVSDAVGVCGDGRCTYAVTATPCEGVGAYCDAGVCRTADPCLGVTCNIPPAPRCDGRVVRASATVGTCVAGDCEYPPADIDCAATGRFCQAGACVDIDPCAGVTCTPPAPTCDGTVRVTATASTCSAGGCVPTLVRTDCADSGAVCVGGVCEGAERCDGVVCNTPPGDVCVDGEAIAWNAAGRCIAGTCSYTQTRTDCDATGRFCVDGVCLTNDPCGATTCNNPPADVCDGNVRVATTGSLCTEGVCTYEIQRQDCGALRCDDGQCVTDDPCRGVTCTLPPAARCDGQEAVSFSAPSACVDGDCVWNTARVDCAATGLSCDNGSCVDRCAGVTCNEATTRCGPGNTVVTTAASTCAAGTCELGVETIETCAAGTFCDGERCADPCEGIVCNTPPVGGCQDDQRFFYQSPGSCTLGFCAYSSVGYEDCTETGRTCARGLCIDGDPCAGVTCDTLQTAFCDNGQAVSIDGVGTCGVGGECSWEAVTTRTDCGAAGQTCVQGACVVPPAPLANQLHIVELMPMPQTGTPAWVELRNAAPYQLNLGGVEVTTAGGTLTIPAGTLLDAGDSCLVASSTTVVGLATCASGAAFQLGATGTLTVSHGTEIVDTVTWTAAWPVAAGRSMSVDAISAVLGRALGDVWCVGSTTMTDGNRGTPGETNPPCFGCVLDDECPTLADRCYDGRLFQQTEAASCSDGFCRFFDVASIEDCAE